MKVENIQVFNLDGSFRGLRNPLESHDRSDSKMLKGELHLPTGEIIKNYPYKFVIGEKDLDLAQRLINGGQPHRKFLRQILCSMDITASMSFWWDIDTYKIATEKNSTSRMHSIMKKPITFDMFNWTNEQYTNVSIVEIPDYDDDEIWQDIVNYEGSYQISNHGRCKSIKRYVNGRWGTPKLINEKILSPSINSSGYYVYTLCKENKMKQYYAHRLVAEVFIPNILNKPEVNHLDGNKLNCHFTNLEWATSSENNKHAHDTGLNKVSNFNKIKTATIGRKFSMEQAEDIRKMYKEGIMNTSELAEKYNCYNSTICNIINNKTYNEICLSTYDFRKYIVDHLEGLRLKYLETINKEEKNKILNELINDLPQGYLFTRHWTGNYEVLHELYYWRKDHKQEEIRDFCKIIETMPYAKELICLDKRNIENKGGK